ncbi:MAG: mechanosensitive ion channel [Acidobacteriota bacterium]
MFESLVGSALPSKILCSDVLWPHLQFLDGLPSKLFSEIPGAESPADGVAVPGVASLGEINFTGLLNQAVEIGLAFVEAIIILLVGWILAKIVRSIVVRALKKTQFDNQLAALLTGGRSDKLAVEETAGSLVYGVMMLFVSIEVFQALGLTMITEPLNGLLGQVMGFVPQLFAAGALALLAWCAASLARVVAKNLLQNLNLDRYVDQASDGGEVDGQTEESEQDKPAGLTDTLSDAVYYFVFLFFLPQMLDALRMEGLRPVQDMVGEILAIVPDLIGAAVMLAVLYFVARIVQRLTTQVLAGTGVDQLPERLGLTEPKGPKVSEAAGWVVLVAMVGTGAVQAAENLGLEMVADAAHGLMAVMVQVLVAGGILVVGLYLSQLAQTQVAAWESARGRKTAPLAAAARVGVLGVAWVMALAHSGLAPEIVHLAFGALVVGMAIALGLAFGLGGRKSAERWLESRRSTVGDHE